MMLCLPASEQSGTPSKKMAKTVVMTISGLFGLLPLSLCENEWAEGQLKDVSSAKQTDNECTHQRVEYAADHDLNVSELSVYSGNEQGDKVRNRPNGGKRKSSQCLWYGHERDACNQPAIN
jgi:hypothetical protein